MRPQPWLLAAGLAATLAASEARAHFLFVRVGPFAESGRTAEVFFSERADAGDPKFVGKIAGTRLWAQEEPGEFRPLDVREGADRLRAHVPGSGAVGVVGVCEYGVLARPGETPFLLRYYPKALAGTPEGLNRLEARPGAPLEIVARFEGERVRLSALVDGKPRPGVTFHVVDADLVEDTVEVNSDGEATWAPEAPGSYSIYFRHDTGEAGSVDGRQYDEIRSFATLAIDWPLVREGADDEAVALFRDALEARAVWGDDFPGFAAEVRGSLEGRSFSGRVTVDDAGNVAVEGLGSSAGDWVTDRLRSIAMHRLGGGDEEPVLRFADPADDRHPLGRLLAFEGGRFASSYRIRDRQIRVVNRHVGDDNLTITTLDNVPDAEGRFLPRSYVVQYWDDASGALRRVETVRERWERVGGFDLPAEQTATIATGGAFSVRHLELSGHRLLQAPTR